MNLILTAVLFFVNPEPYNADSLPMDDVDHAVELPTADD